MSIRVEPSELLNWLQVESVPYVVLRDGDLVRAHCLADLHDLDLLIEDAAIPALKKRFSKARGTLKVDVYGAAGQHGTDYHGFPHLPEAMARSAIAGCIRANGVCLPSPGDELLALVYHLAYHKNFQSGVHWADAKLSADNVYTRRVTSLLASAGQQLELTLNAFHEYLCRYGYAVSEERLIAYLQHDFRSGRKSYFHALLQDRQPGELNLFVIRGIALKHGCYEQLLDKLRQRFDVVAVKPIPWLTRWRTRKQMRGGKWKRGGKPHVAIVTFDREPEVSTSAERAVHPFVFNRNQFVKLEWRDWFTTHSSARQKDNPIHSTDNEAEAFGHLPLFFDPQERSEIHRRLQSLRGEVSACGH